MFSQDEANRKVLSSADKTEDILKKLATDPDVSAISCFACLAQIEEVLSSVSGCTLNSEVRGSELRKLRRSRR